jgi:predicted ester cyclase
MSVETNKALVNRFFDEVFNKRNLDVIDEFIAPNFVNHNSRIPMTGQAGARQTISAELLAFPDLHTTVEDIIAEGDKVVVRCTDHFTRPADGSQVSLSWIEILRLENGRAVEAWFEADTSSISPGIHAALGGEDAP